MGFWKHCRRHIWAFGVLAGTLFLLIGARLEQLDVIWKKAVLICLECIGIG